MTTNNRKGTNQYRVKPKYHFWGSVWFVAFIIMTGCFVIEKTKPAMKSPCSMFPCVLAEELPAPKTKDDIIKSSKHPNELFHIWKRESSYGTNTNPNALHNICKAKGKSNEFGYGGMQMMICFNSFEESVKRVDEWLDKQSDITLCYYNTGVKTNECSYIK